MLSGWLTLPVSCRGFQFNCSGEQDVVLQMDVLVEIRLEIIESLEELQTGRTPGSVRQMSSNGGEHGACIFVFVFHHRNWVSHCSKT